MRATVLREQVNMHGMLVSLATSLWDFLGACAQDKAVSVADPESFKACVSLLSELKQHEAKGSQVRIPEEHAGWVPASLEACKRFDASFMKATLAHLQTLISENGLEAAASFLDVPDMPQSLQNYSDIVERTREFEEVDATDVTPQPKEGSDIVYDADWSICMLARLNTLAQMWTLDEVLLQQLLPEVAEKCKAYEEAVATEIRDRIVLVNERIAILNQNVQSYRTDHLFTP